MRYGQRSVRIAGNEHPLLALEVLWSAYRLLKRDGAAYVFCGTRHLSFVRSFFSQYTRYRLRDVLIWDKVSMGAGSPFRKQYECILALEKGRPRYRSRRMLNVLHYKRVRTGRHPHTKPLPLIKALIAHSSDPSSLVLDPFVGSGTTALAAKQLGRRYIGIEVDPAYCRIATNCLKQGTLPLAHTAPEPEERLKSATFSSSIYTKPSLLQNALW